MKIILFVASILAAFLCGVLIGRDKSDAVLMAIAIAITIGIGVVLMRNRKPSRKIDAYVVSEKREPANVNHRLSKGQR